MLPVSGPKYALQHTIKTTADSQLTGRFCNCMTGNNLTKTGGGSLCLSVYECVHVVGLMWTVLGIFELLVGQKSTI